MDKLGDIIERLDDILYLMETMLPSWICAGELMRDLHGISDSLKQICDEEK